MIHYENGHPKSLERIEMIINLNPYDFCNPLRLTANGHLNNFLFSVT